MTAGRIRGDLGYLLCSLVIGMAGWEAAAAEPLAMEPRMIHLRSSSVREWSDYPAEAEGSEREIRFNAGTNVAEGTLCLRQSGVRQLWRLTLNGKRLGDLTQDENDMVIYLPVAPGVLAEGENVLRIESPNAKPATSDDIRVGEIRLDPRVKKSLLGESTLEVGVTEEQSRQPLPCRITIATPAGSLQTTGAASTPEMAVREGVVYTATGKATIPLPAGKFTIYVGRGFEYSLATTSVDLAPGETKQIALSLAREVPTPGFVACDTHIHTLTHSGHGDCTIQERLITLAGEGIELPIATDHNVQIDYRPLLGKNALGNFFTPVIGNEVTTSVGHFNIFPTTADSPKPDPTPKDWTTLFDNMNRTRDVKAIILNHARDLHSGVRPFGPKHHIGIAGENLEGWPLRMNAMEVMNSGATQTEGGQLIADWMALLNRGYNVTPVGSSDSHDVARYIVGQGRTYIRAVDSDPAAIDVPQAVQNFVQGRVAVSYGLLTELIINERFGPGETAFCPEEKFGVHIRVLGPHWTKAEKLQLFANGALLREEAIPERDANLPRGVQYEASWRFPRPKQDVHLVAVAWGPGIDGPYWPTARPYQPTSPAWKAHTLGVSGAVWLDADRDGRKSTAREYAEHLFAQERGDFGRVADRLANFDEATVIQAASWYRSQGGSLDSEEYLAALKQSTPAVQTGLQKYRDAYRASERARVMP